MYTVYNFAHKSSLIAAVKSGEAISVFQPGPFAAQAPRDGVVTLEGPHYPAPHRWYATATLKDGVIVSVK